MNTHCCRVARRISIFASIHACHEERAAKCKGQGTNPGATVGRGGREATGRPLLPDDLNPPNYQAACQLLQLPALQVARQHLHNTITVSTTCLFCTAFQQLCIVQDLDAEVTESVAWFLGLAPFEYTAMLLHTQVTECSMGSMALNQVSTHSCPFYLPLY